MFIQLYAIPHFFIINLQYTHQDYYELSCPNNIRFLNYTILRCLKNHNNNKKIIPIFIISHSRYGHNKCKIRIRIQEASLTRGSGSASCCRVYTKGGDIGCHNTALISWLSVTWPEPISWSNLHRKSDGSIQAPCNRLGGKREWWETKAYTGSVHKEENLVLRFSKVNAVPDKVFHCMLNTSQHHADKFTTSTCWIPHNEYFMQNNSQLLHAEYLTMSTSCRIFHNYYMLNTSQRVLHAE